MRPPNPRTPIILGAVALLAWRIAATGSVVLGVVQTVPIALIALAVVALLSRRGESGKARGLAGPEDASPPADADPPAPPSALEPPADADPPAPPSALDPPEPFAGDEADEAARDLLEACSERFDVMAVHCWLKEPGSPNLRKVGAAGSLTQPDGVLPADDDPVGLTAADGRDRLTAIAMLRTPDRSWTLWRFAHAFEAGGAKAVVGVDVRSQEAPDAGELHAAAASARQAFLDGLALYPAREVMGSAKELLEAARRLASTLRPEQIAEEALHVAMSLCGAETGSVMLLDEGTGRMRIVASRGLPSEVVAGTEVREGEGIAGWVLMTGQPVLVQDRETSTRRGERERRSSISAPIRDEALTLGVINVSAPLFPAGFRDKDLEVLRVLAVQTASALRNASVLTSARELYLAALRALVLALETKDPYARGSTDRVVEYATMLGVELGLDRTETEALRAAALLHDVGMVAARYAHDPSSAELDAGERELIDRHPAFAVEMLREAPALRLTIPIVYHHHEWFDGRGYMSGLAGQEIPLGARALAVADAYVAMTSERPYRVTLSPEEALEELREKSGTQFDPAVVEAFARLLEAGEEPASPSSARSA